MDCLLLQPQCVDCLESKSCSGSTTASCPLQFMYIVTPLVETAKSDVLQYMRFQVKANSGLQEMQDEGKLGVRGGEVGLKKALNPKKKIPFALKEKISLSHNTRLFRFALQSSEHQLGLPTGQHMFFYCKVHILTSTVTDWQIKDLLPEVSVRRYPSYFSSL